eukprot:3951928-Karenia_brevis.AAC.1
MLAHPIEMGLTNVDVYGSVGHIEHDDRLYVSLFAGNNPWILPVLYRDGIHSLLFAPCILCTVVDCFGEASHYPLLFLFLRCLDLFHPEFNTSGCAPFICYHAREFVVLRELRLEQLYQFVGL